MNKCSGILNKETKLVGILNNTIINKGGSGGDSTSFLIEDTLLRAKWIEIVGEGKFVYQYSNPRLDNNYFIQITPDVTDSQKENLDKAGILQNIYMDSEISKIIYNIYSKNRPLIDIKISILATNIGKE